ncbi:MAG: cytochrome c oxidase subunit II, partial [Pseudomonadota bacterium]
DVIHNFAMPSFGLKMDVIPGRLNETWFRAEEEGTYFGQCSELCGINHAYMPITIEVVSQEAYDAWVAEQVAEMNGDTDVADAGAVGAGVDAGPADAGLVAE